MTNQPADNYVFQVTPAPSGQNSSKEIWTGYLNDTITAINVFDERTNTLIGTIGGNTEYRFLNLPSRTVISETLPNELKGDCFELGLTSNLYNVRLSNGNIGRLDGVLGFCKDNILLYNFRDLEILGDYWVVAFKINDENPKLLEKIADLKVDSGFSLWSYTYVSPSMPGNQIKLTYNTYPLNDSSLIQSKVVTLTVNKATNSNSYYITTDTVNYNFGGATALSLYNQYASTPALPGTINYIYRTPIYSGQNSGNEMLNGKDEGWIWYGDGVSFSNLLSYMVGFNILTGETAFIRPIDSLAATTNLNPLGVVDETYFNNFFLDAESHPAGMVFTVYNKRVLNNGNNTDGITALYSPRWKNNDTVTFLTNRNLENGQYSNSNAFILFNSIAIDIGWNYDPESIYLYQSDAASAGVTYNISKFKLDTSIKENESINIPIGNDGYQFNSNFYGYNDGFIFDYSEAFYNNFGGNQYGIINLIFWNNNNNQIYQLQSNCLQLSYRLGSNGQKFLNNDGLFLYNSYKMGVFYDEYDILNK